MHMGHSGETDGSSEDKMIVLRCDWDEEDTDVKEEPVGLTFGPVFDIGGPEYFFLSHP